MRRIMCCKTSKNYVINTQGSLCTEREMQMAGNVPRVEREREMQARGFGERRFGICLYLSCNGSGKLESLHLLPQTQLMDSNHVIDRSSTSVPAVTRRK